MRTIFLQTLKDIFQDYGDCVTPSPDLFDGRLAKHKNLPDTCFHILDLRKLTLMKTHGTERIFGIPSSHFNYSALGNAIHPSYVPLYMAKAIAVYHYLDFYPDTVHPDMPYYYNVFLPMKLKGGKYHRVRQMSIPYGLDKNGKMVLQLNIYRTGFEPYKGQPMTSFFSSSDDKPQDNLNRKNEKRPY